ncbi:uracil-DNA glycosylase [Desulfonema magnum]|uniref:Type-4 uracil-DNA glycosylase n=1 Tax=Desulfonema magnum TaxID=45655 RepID=A0A975BT70_9BACT|nr:uracil-DNA glycosylase [Desulfonema magnum]QTA91022.1 Uracil DNA glycolyase superfamily protein [Desulfonema magnum]
MVQAKHFVAITEDVKNYLRFLNETTGCHGFDCSEKSLDLIKNWGKKETPARIRKQASDRDQRYISDRSRKQASDKTLYPPDERRRIVLPKTLGAIRTDLGDCHRCKLFKGRKNIVFGAGNPRAQLVFVGEGPGYDEDQAGEPFVGEAGQLLTKIIQAMKLTREDIYICNIIKCRPPGNRDPEPDEIKACSPFLKRQLEAIKPDFICALGTFAAQSLLGTEKPISELRGRFYDYMDMKVMPTFHPEYLLRYPQKKRDVWEDVQKLMKSLGIN